MTTDQQAATPALLPLPEPSDRFSADKRARELLERLRIIGLDSDWSTLEAIKRALADPANCRMVRFVGLDPAGLTRGATHPMLRDSWRFGFRESLTDHMLEFKLLDNGNLVAFDAVDVPMTDPRAPSPEPATTPAPNLPAATIAESFAYATRQPSELEAMIDALRQIYRAASIHDARRIVVKTMGEAIIKRSDATTPTPASSLSDEHCARFFHDTYERLAPEFGYETRPDTKEFNPESKNGRLMIAVCGKVKAAIEALVRSEPQPEALTGEPVRCADCDLPNGCPEYCHCDPVNKAMRIAFMNGLGFMQGNPDSWPADWNAAADEWIASEHNPMNYPRASTDVRNEFGGIGDKQLNEADLMQAVDIYARTPENKTLRAEVERIANYLAAPGPAAASGASRLTDDPEFFGMQCPACEFEFVTGAMHDQNMEIKNLRAVLVERKRQQEAEGWTPEHVVFYNDRPQIVSLDEVTAFDLRAIFMIEPMYEIVVESEGPHPDRPLRDEDVIRLGERPLRVFSRPPTVYGKVGTRDVDVAADIALYDAAVGAASGASPEPTAAVEALSDAAFRRVFEKHYGNNRTNGVNGYLRQGWDWARTALAAQQDGTVGGI